jgi:hypothetical protein
LPVGAGAIVRPAVGMDGANQRLATVAGGAIGNAMVVGAATAGGRARGGRRCEPHLRTQNVLLTLYPMPLFVGSAVAAGIGSTKQILWERHNR